MLKILLLRRLFRLLFLFLISSFSVVSAKTSAPEMLLLRVYQDQAVTGWLMSEKLDGVRALWDGKQLRFRSGGLISAPEWFLAGLPKFALDGELWTRRGDFENIVSIVRRQQPDQRWHEITYNIFEVPNQTGGLLKRLSVLEGYLQRTAVPYLKIIPQVQIQSEQHFRNEIKRLLSLGAEGLVLRRPNQPYVTGRHSSALKVKPFQDDECQVIGVTPGKGKYQGQAGALICQWQAQRILLGSGLSDKERQNPPGKGTWVTFKYYGLTALGRPRFPVFLRVRSDKD